MTREDAILCLKGIKNYGRDTFTSKSQGDWQESLDMAIEALEKELEKEYLFESLCDDLKKAQAEIERLEHKLEQEPKVDLDELKQHFYELSYALDSHSAFKEYEELRRTHHENIGWMESKGLEEEYYKVLFEHIKAKDEKE